MFWATHPVEAGIAGAFLAEIAERFPRLVSPYPAGAARLLPLSITTRRAHYTYTTGRSVHVFEDGTALYVLRTRIAPWVLTGLQRSDGHAPISPNPYQPSPFAPSGTPPQAIGPAGMAQDGGDAASLAWPPRTPYTDTDPRRASVQAEIAFHEAVLAQVEQALADLDADGRWSVASAPGQEGCRTAWSAWRTCPPTDATAFRAAGAQLQRFIEALFSPLLRLAPQGFQGLTTGVVVKSGTPPFPGVPGCWPVAHVTTGAGGGRMWHGDPTPMVQRLEALRAALQVSYGEAWDPARFLHHDPFASDRHAPRPGTDPTTALRRTAGHILSAPLQASTLPPASAHQKIDALAWLQKAGVEDASSLL